MPQLIFKNARIFDGIHADCPEGMSVRVADGRIQEVSAQPLGGQDAHVLDVAGRTLMPGLIDAHVHAFASDVLIQRIEALCSCGDRALFNTFAVLADGVDACIRAAREELRQGAHCIKIMGSGGVLSPTDPIWMNQYREDEIRAIVNECVERRTYVASHCHPASAVRRSVEFGVRSIEHGTLIDDETARFVAERGAYIVPTMAVINALVETGRQVGLPAQTQEKAHIAFESALAGLNSMRRAGVKVCFGTDLLGSTYGQQCREFTLRSEVFTPVEILRQATSVPAEMMMMRGQIGCIEPGAHADLIVVDGDPLKDVALLAADGRSLRVIVRAGVVVKNELR